MPLVALLAISEQEFVQRVTVEKGPGGPWELYEMCLQDLGIEEMLKAYTKAYAATKNPLYKKITQEIITLVDKRFNNDSLLYSASDADSLTGDGKKEEGYYFVFDFNQTKKYLKQAGYQDNQAKKILSYFNITPVGNFENRLTNPNIFNSKPIADIDKIKTLLTKFRSQKSYPFIDHKILTSWNAMYISSLFNTSNIDDKYGKQGTQMLDKLLQTIYPKQILYHQKLQGKRLKVKALFEDYAFIIDALVSGYEYNYDKRYLTLASVLTKEAAQKFYHQKKWWLSDDSYKTPADITDSAYASALSIMSQVLFKVSVLTDDYRLNEIAEQTIQSLSGDINQYPVSAPTAYNAYLGYKFRYKVLKATKEILNKYKTEIQNQHIPFLLTKAQTLEDPSIVQACTISSCFAQSKSIKQILKSIVDYK